MLLADWDLVIGISSIAAAIGTIAAAWAAWYSANQSKIAARGSDEARQALVYAIKPNPLWQSFPAPEIGRWGVALVNVSAHAALDVTVELKRGKETLAQVTFACLEPHSQPWPATAAGNFPLDDPREPMDMIITYSDSYRFGRWETRFQLPDGHASGLPNDRLPDDAVTRLISSKGV